MACAHAARSRGGCASSECVAVKRHLLQSGARSDHGDDIKAIAELSQVVERYELLRGPAEDLLLLPVDELPWIAESTGSSRLDLDEDEGIGLDGYQVQLAGPPAKPAREDVIALLEEEPACDTLPEPALQKMWRSHTLNVYCAGVVFQESLTGACGFEICRQATQSEIRN